MTVLDEVKRLNTAAAASGRPPQKPVSNTGRPFPATSSPSTEGNDAPTQHHFQSTHHGHLPAEGLLSAKPAHLNQDIQHSSSNQSLLASHAVDDESNSQDGAISLDGQHADSLQEGQAAAATAFHLREGQLMQDSHATVPSAQGSADHVRSLHTPQHVQRATAENAPAPQLVQRVTAENIHAPQQSQRVTAENSYPASPTDTIAAVKAAEPAGVASTNVNAMTGHQQPWSPPVSHQAQLPHAPTEDVSTLTARDARGKPQDAMGNAIKRILPDQDAEPLILHYRRRGFNDFLVRHHAS